jgi:hypothetical protein
MLLQRLEPLDRETAIAITLLWVVGFAVALVVGEGVIPAAGMSLLAVGGLSIGYAVADANMRELVSRPAGAVCFFAGASIVAGFSFAGDCIFGSIHAAGMPLLAACVEQSGIGFAFTVLCVALAVGVPAIGLLRSAIARAWRRGG